MRSGLEDMTDVVENGTGHSDEEWRELKTFIAEVVDKHTDLEFIETLANSLDEHVANKLRVRAFIEILR